MLKTRGFVCVAIMKLSHTMIGTMTISTAVDQILALPLRAVQRVPRDKHVSLDMNPGRVEIYEYPQTRRATVEQNNLHWVITMTISSVVDQTLALSRRAGQRVLEDKHVSLTGEAPGCVEIYGYPQTRPATVEQNNLHIVIGLVIISICVVPSPAPASVT